MTTVVGARTEPTDSGSGAEPAVKRPGLQMVRPTLADLPPLEGALNALPPGYGFRTYREGDEAAWAEIMNTGQMDEWDAERTREKLTGLPYPRFDPEGLFFVTWGAAEAPVGSACAYVREAEERERERGILHMVCVLPEHRGKNLSYAPCLAVLHRFRERGYGSVMLNTGDWRLGAVKVYLKLGFQPLYRHPMHPGQWREVGRALGWSAPLAPVLDPSFGKEMQ